MRLFAKIPTVMAFAIAAGGMFVPACSCGDDGGNPDARPVFDAPPTPDADDTDAAEIDADVADLRSGTIAVSEVRLTNNPATLGLPAGTEVKGAGVSVTYSDLTTATVAPTVGSNDIGECTVWVYTVGTNAPPDEADEGAVSISGTGITPNTFPTCTFVSALGEYKCFGTAPGALADASVVTWDFTSVPGSIITTLEVPGVDFGTMGAVGMVVNLRGLPGSVTGVSGATYTNNGDHMIINIDPLGGGANKAKIQLINFAVLGGLGASDITPAQVLANLNETYTASGGSATYGVVAGTTPIVTGGPDPGGFQFITDATQDITVAKAAGGLVPAFSVTLKASSGDGLTLGDTSAQPHALTVAATGNVDNTFTCAASDNGDCGTARNDSGASQIVGWTLSGSTTDADLTGTLPIQMPDPETSWAEFVCKGVPGSDSIKLTAAALDAIMGTSPTRISVRLLRVTADITSAPYTSIVSGHGLVGFYTVP